MLNYQEKTTKTLKKFLRMNRNYINLLEGIAKNECQKRINKIESILKERGSIK